MNGTLHTLACRPGFESALAEEVTARIPSAVITTPGPGAVCVESPRLPPQPFIFERTRLSPCLVLPAGKMNPIDPQCFKSLASSLAEASACGIQLVKAGDDTDGNLGRKLQGFRKALVRGLERETGAGFDAENTEGPCVFGLYFSSCCALAAASSPPAGFEQPEQFRMKLHPDAPSRSYLKLEEVFSRWNLAPRRDETAVDLGAAPGGWTLSLLQHGCSVTAVDHGPMKLPRDLPGQVEHLRANGLTYKPPRTPVDWMTADMLIPPGTALGLLKRWIGSRWTRHFVVNIKLPQRHPWKALQPIHDYLEREHGLAFQVRQLYHDRREVTAWGSVAAPRR